MSERAPGRLCLTGGERTAAALAARLAAHPDLLHELRLDLLETIDDEAFALLASPRVIATCRSRAEGGAFAGTEEERARVLERALAAGPGFLDLELSTPRPLRERLRATARTRLILSSHAHGGIEEGRERARALAAEPADLYKLAVRVEDPAELAELRALLGDAKRPVLRIGMGGAGLLSRALPDRFGSPWSYVVPEGAAPIAPGQLDLARARALRLPDAERLTPLALLGGEQVLRSPGPIVYNRLFAARGLPYLYLPVASTRPRETLSLLASLGCAGVSITMPFKERLLAEAATLDPLAREAGALNTIRLGPGPRAGFLTDASAARRLLGAHAGRPALLLGAGGAARAVAAALRALGCPLSVAARRLEQARALAPLGARAVPWAARAEVPFALLVNATPCGADGHSDPLPAEVELAGRCVLELVLAREAPTPLVARARAAGATVIDGLAFWLEQGALQLEALLGLRVTPAELARYLA